MDFPSEGMELTHILVVNEIERGKFAAFLEIPMVTYLRSANEGEFDLRESQPGPDEHPKPNTRRMLARVQLRASS